MNIGKDIDLVVALITYNHEKYISQAIKSILSQKTHYSFQIVIIDDASTDNTQEIVKKYQNKIPR